MWLLDIAAHRAFAQAVGAPAQPGFSEVLGKMAPMFLIVFVVFHFFIIKPQKQKEAQHAELIKNLKVGEAVSTSSGMIGRVAAIAADVITLEIASNVKVKFTPTSIVKKEETK
jgi:preprotein translocase subunit YajC